MVGNVSSRLNSLRSRTLSPSDNLASENEFRLTPQSPLKATRSEHLHWLQELTRSNNGAPCPTVGFVRCERWSADLEASFVYLQQLVVSGTVSKRVTAVIPWRLSTPSQLVLSFDLVADEFDATLVSRVLREIPLWRRQSDLVFLELGLLGSPAARALAPWCNRIFLYSPEKSLPKAKMVSKMLKTWLAEGLSLNGAIQVG